MRILVSSAMLELTPALKVMHSFCRGSAVIRFIKLIECLVFQPPNLVVHALLDHT